MALGRAMERIIRKKTAEGIEPKSTKVIVRTLILHCTLDVSAKTITYSFPLSYFPLKLYFFKFQIVITHPHFNKPYYICDSFEPLSSHGNSSPSYLIRLHSSAVI